MAQEASISCLFYCENWYYERTSSQNLQCRDLRHS